MMGIKIICVGNLKEKFWVDACREYAKRLSRFCKLTICEVDEENALCEKEKILAKEGDAILKKLNGQATLLALEGKQFSSEDFADFIEKHKLEGGEITFVIGGSYGVSQEVKNTAKEKISLGKITLPHNLARVVLLEQIYRAFMIISGSTYHK